MIERKVAEQLWPDFVKKVDELVTEADDFCREVMGLGPRKASRRITTRYPRKGREAPLQAELLLILAEHGPAKMPTIYRLVEGSKSYNSISQQLQVMAGRGQVIRIRRGVYDLPIK